MRRAGLGSMARGRGMARSARGTTEEPDQGLDVFLNTNIWLATAFALALLTAIFALLFLLTWLEPSRRKQTRWTATLTVRSDKTMPAKVSGPRRASGRV